MSNLIRETKDFTDERRHKLGEALAKWFEDNVGLPTEMLFYDISGKALGILQTRMAEAQKQQEADEVVRRKLWASKRGMIYPKDYIIKYRISEQELRMAVNMHMLKSDYQPGVRPSFWGKVIIDRPLTNAELATLADSVMLTANQAARRLGIDPSTFNRLKKKHNLQPFEMRRSRDSEWPFAVYKLADVDRLKI